MNIFTLLISLRSPIENLCVITYPLSAISIILALLFSDNDVLNTKAHPELLTHIFLSFLAMSLLTLANIQAILMSWQNYLLKHQRPNAMLRILPPLQTMETLLFSIIICGMLFLCGSLLTGFYYRNLYSARFYYRRRY